MARLGLGVADISWQPARDRLVEYVGVLGLIGGSLAKVAAEIVSLAHNEIDEVGEPFTEGKVGSSTMPHKRNPVIAEGVVAVGRTLRHTVALMHDALIVEHERDAMAWRIEWKALPEACLMTGAILEKMKYILAGLEVNPGKMRHNLDVLGGFLLSERVMFALAEPLGKQTAHEAVYDASMRGIAEGISFEQALMESPKVAARHRDPGAEGAARPHHLCGLRAGDRRARARRGPRDGMDGGGMSGAGLIRRGGPIFFCKSLEFKWVQRYQSRIGPHLPTTRQFSFFHRDRLATDVRPMVC